MDPRDLVNTKDYEKFAVQKDWTPRELDTLFALYIVPICELIQQSSAWTKVKTTYLDVTLQYHLFPFVLNKDLFHGFIERFKYAFNHVVNGHGSSVIKIGKKLVHSERHFGFYLTPRLKEKIRNKLREEIRGKIKNTS